MKIILRIRVPPKAGLNLRIPESWNPMLVLIGRPYIFKITGILLYFKAIIMKIDGFPLIFHLSKKGLMPIKEQKKLTGA
jgi:hypothetical protein